MPAVLDFTTIQPGAVYTPREVADLMRVTVETVIGWIEGRELSALGRVRRGRYRILGLAVLAFAGLAPTPQTMTPAARSKRAADDREAIRRMK